MNHITAKESPSHSQTFPGLVTLATKCLTIRKNAAFLLRYSNGVGIFFTCYDGDSLSVHFLYKKIPNKKFRVSNINVNIRIKYIPNTMNSKKDCLFVV